MSNRRVRIVAERRNRERAPLRIRRQDQPSAFTGICKRPVNSKMERGRSCRVTILAQTQIIRKFETGLLYRGKAKKGNMNHERVNTLAIWQCIETRDGTSYSGTACSKGPRHARTHAHQSNPPRKRVLKYPKRMLNVDRRLLQMSPRPSDE